MRSVRIGRRVIQHTVTHLGELDEAGRLRARALIGQPEQADLFDDGTGEQTIGVRLKGVRIENGRAFGNQRRPAWPSVGPVCACKVSCLPRRLNGHLARHRRNC